MIERILNGLIHNTRGTLSKPDIAGWKFFPACKCGFETSHKINWKGVTKLSQVKQVTYLQIFRKYPDVVSVSELCEMLDIGSKTAYQLIHDNKIEHFKIGRAFKIPKVNVIKYMSLDV